MKKDSIAKLQVRKIQIRRMAAKQRLTVGLDLGDRSSRYCILNEAGGKASEDQLPTTKAGLDSLFGKMAACRIALEVGTHSPWVSRHLAGMGHEVIVANPRKVRLITQSVKKNDRMDAEQLARLARAAGFTDIEFHGGVRGETLTPDSPRCTLVAGRPT